MDLLIFIAEVLVFPIFWVALLIGGAAGFAMSYILFSEPRPEIIVVGVAIGGVIGIGYALNRLINK